MPPDSLSTTTKREGSGEGELPCIAQLKERKKGHMNLYMRRKKAILNCPRESLTPLMWGKRGKGKN